MTEAEYNKIPEEIWEKYNRASSTKSPDIDLKELISDTPELNLSIKNDSGRYLIAIITTHPGKGLKIESLVSKDDQLLRNIGVMVSALYKKHLEVIHNIP